MAKPRDYEVGYGKPPKHSRFKSGQSGNPGGRQKGSRGLKTDLQAELVGLMTIRINGEPVKGTRQRLFVRALASRAAAGDLKAAQILAPLIIQVLGVEDRGADRGRLSRQDQAILDEFMAADLPYGDPAAHPVTSDGKPSDDRPNDPDEDDLEPVDG